MTVIVRNSPSLSETPYVLSQEDTTCVTSKTVRVPIPTGATSVYVQEIYSGVGGGISSNYTISTQTDIQIVLDAFKSATPASNVWFSEAYLRVSLTASDPVYYSTGITRYSTNTQC